MKNEKWKMRNDKSQSGLVRSDRLPSEVRQAGMPVLLRGQCRLCSGESRDRHAKRRAAYVVESNLMAKSDRAWVAAMLATNSDFQILLHAASAIRAFANQLAHT